MGEKIFINRKIIKKGAIITQNYIYTDLAIENNFLPNTPINKAKESIENEESTNKLFTLTIDSKELSQKYGRPQGRYVTLSCKKIWLMTESELEEASDIIGSEVAAMLSLKTKKDLKTISVLVVGLGHSDITPDALGPLTVSRLRVNRHIASIDPFLFESLDQCTVSAFIPGVLAQTGIETVELVQGAVQKTSPDAVIAIDSLASRSCDRLAATVQISDVGICPGSGIGNKRKAINEENLGVPVISMHAPYEVVSKADVYSTYEAFCAFVK